MWIETALARAAVAPPRKPTWKDSHPISEQIPAEKLDPPRSPRAEWRRQYAAELAGNVGVHLDLAAGNPVAAIARRAKMTPAETDVFRLWAAGDSLRSIARGTGKQLRTVRTLLERAQFRLQSLDRRAFVAHPPTRSVEEPCRTAPETSPQRSSLGSSIMLVAS